MPARAMSIGEAAKQSGVKVPTIRYYEEIGLLPVSPRTQSNRRLYEGTELRRLAFIRHARELGFGVDAIRALLSLQDHPEQSCQAADEIARVRLAEVEHRLESLSALKNELEQMIAQCAKGRVKSCRVIETLADQSHAHGRLDRPAANVTR